jgi:protein-tyrosine kinase
VSLVEKALKKLQAARPADSRSGPPTAPLAPVSTQDTELQARAQPVPTPATVRQAAAQTLQINREQLRIEGMLPAVSQERELSNQFRAIKRPLVDFATQPPTEGNTSRRTLMVASALPGDGKTFTSLNLALSLALEKDLHVLLVDADVPKPHLTTTFGLTRSMGLLDAVTDGARRIQDLIVPTDIPHLDFLPAGTLRENATELLASARMDEVVERLAAIYEHGIVVFDSPPILLTNESRALAALLGQIVLVIRAGQTPQQAVRDAIQIVGAERNISLILNQADLKGAMGYYYGYGYGYGQQGQSAAPSPRAK